MSAVSDVMRLHAELLGEYPGTLTVGEVLQRQAETLLAAHAAGDATACVQLSNWLPTCVGRTNQQILEADLSIDDMRTAVAREHGFASWTDVEKVADRVLDAEFERAANAVVDGNVKLLTLLLDNKPALVHQASPYGHRATLLHYIAANGVETWRQRVPANAVDVTKLLLDRGANVNATARVYGGEFNTMALLTSSAHPAEAGLTEPIAEVLGRG